MSRYLPATEVGGHYAIAVCPRCKLKVHYGNLVEDPDTRQKLCPKCVDLPDPYRGAYVPEDRIVLEYPRPDEPLVIPEE